MAEIAETHGSSWVRVGLISADTFGFEFLAKNINPDFPDEIAVKSVLASLSGLIKSEKELLCNLGSGSCSNVLRRCYGDEITTTKSGKKIYNVLLEYCSGSSLYKHIRKFGANGLAEAEVRRYTRDIVHGLCYLHCNARYIHCNINSKGILLSPSSGSAGGGALVAKIASLESAKELTSEVSGCDFRGSHMYMSPEANAGYLDWPADIWALGCVVLEMLNGVFRDTEFQWDNDYELPKIPKHISKAGKDFLRRCFLTSPYKRTPIWLLVKHLLFLGMMPRESDTDSLILLC